MKDIISSIWKRICAFFTKDRVANVWKILFDGAVTVTVSILTNETLMNAAFEISLSLLGLKSTRNGKTAEFNMKMSAWCAEHGISELCEADMNLVREVSYAAVRSKVGISAEVVDK